MAQSTAPGKSIQLPKKLIVLCDGTWMNSDFGWEKSGILDPGHAQVPTNVTRLARAIKRQSSDRHPQVIYYQAGVGSSAWSIVDHFLGGGLAYGISQNIREAYGFLAHNYLKVPEDDGDEIYLLGFSRGAFTARSVGGMISGIGLLEKEAMQYFYFIFEDFENAGKSHYKPKLMNARKDFVITADSKDVKAYLSQYKSELLKLKLTRDVKIQAIAVYDTVGTLGVPIHPWIQKLGLPSALHGYRFFDTGISNSVKHAYQALALDERRAAFQASVWERELDNTTTELKQIWVPGAHTDIGGGYPESSQSDMTMAWIIDQLRKFIDFNEDYLIDQFESNRKNNFTINNNPDLTKPAPAKPYWHWGLGTVHKSLKFPTSLAGSSTRTPGRYVKLNYDTGKPDAKDKRLLRETNEFIHSSVRVRREKKEIVEQRKMASIPPALKDFRCDIEDKADGTRAATWTYTIKGGLDENVVLREAPMGQLEKRLLGYDKVTENELQLA